MNMRIVILISPEREESALLERWDSSRRAQSARRCCSWYRQQLRWREKLRSRAVRNRWSMGTPTLYKAAAGRARVCEGDRVVYDKEKSNDSQHLIDRSSRDEQTCDDRGKN